MTFKPRIWYPIAAVVAILNVIAAGFAADPPPARAGLTLVLGTPSGRGRAFRVSDPLPATVLARAARLRSAFSSLSIASPQRSQRNVRSEGDSLAFTVPQAEQVFDDG